MKMIHCPLGLLGAAGALLFAFSGAVTAHEGEKETATFAYKSYPKWTINLPKETFSPIAAEIPIPFAGGKGFTAQMDGTALAVDTNADGKVDTKAKGVASFMTLKGKSENGREQQYSVRLVNQSGWKFAASGVMAGKVKGVQLRLIDQNNNGKYNDVGEDAMIVGQGDAACFLSNVVNLDGALYSIEVGEDGSQVTATPYTGAAGTLNLDGSFTTQGILSSAVVKSTNNEISFNLAGEKKGLLVPAGDYVLTYGTVTAGAESVRIRAGKMKPIVVADKAAATPAWGGPLKAEFTWTHSDGVLTIRPQDLFFFGAAGEEYFDWKPDGQPPTFVVKDAKTGRELLKARFGGC